jgi:multicomponent Na+:H+ antiporter subunit G
MIGEITLYVSGGLMVIAGLFSLLACVGMLRFPDVYTRLHAASKAGTLGLGLVFIAAAIASLDGWVAVRALAGLVFLLLTAPVAAHILALAALRSGTQPISNTNNGTNSDPEVIQATSGPKM